MERFNKKYLTGLHDLIVKICKEKTYSCKEIGLLHWRFTEYLDHHNESQDNLNEVLDYICKYILIILKYSENENFESNREFKSNMIKYMSVVEDIASVSQTANGFVEDKTSIIFEHVTDPSIKFTCAKELIRSYNQVIKCTDKSVRAKLLDSSCTFHLYKLADILCTCGDYEYQTHLLETIFRISTSDFIKEHAADFFPETESLQHAFLKINVKDFDNAHRLFLNIVNRVHGNVYSFNANDIFLDEVHVFPPAIGQDKIENLWVDFNMGTNTIGIYCDQACLRNDQISQDSESSGWELITVFANDVSLVDVKKPKCLKGEENIPTLFRFTLSDQFHVKYPASEGVAASKLLKIVVFDNEVIEELQNSVLPNMFKDKFKSYQSGKNKSKTNNDSSSMEIEVTRRTYKPLTVRLVTRTKKSRSIKSMDTRSMKSLEEVLKITKSDTSEGNANSDKHIFAGLTSPNSTMLDTSTNSIDAVPETQYFSAEEDLNADEESLIVVDDYDDENDPVSRPESACGPESDQKSPLDKSKRHVAKDKVRLNLPFVRRGVLARNAPFEPLFSPILETSEVNRSEQSSCLRRTCDESHEATTTVSNNDRTGGNETQYLSPDVISTQASTARETVSLKAGSVRSQAKLAAEVMPKSVRNAQDDDSYNQFCTDILNDIEKGIDSDKWYPTPLLNDGRSDAFAHPTSNGDVSVVSVAEDGFRGFTKDRQEQVDVIDVESLPKSQESTSRPKRKAPRREGVPTTKYAVSDVTLSTDDANKNNCQEPEVSSTRNSKIKTPQSQFSKETKDKIIISDSQESALKDDFAKGERKESTRKSKVKTPRSPFLRSAVQKLSEDGIIISSSQDNTISDDVVKGECKGKSSKKTLTNMKRRQTYEKDNTGSNLDDVESEMAISSNYTRRSANSELQVGQNIRNLPKHASAKSAEASLDSSVIRLPTPSAVVIDLTHVKDSISSCTEATECDLRENSHDKRQEQSSGKQSEAILDKLETGMIEDLMESDNDSTWVDENLLGNTSNVDGNLDVNANVQSEEVRYEVKLKVNAETEPAIISDVNERQKEPVGVELVEAGKEICVDLVDLTSMSWITVDEDDDGPAVTNLNDSNSDVSSAVICGAGTAAVKQRMKLRSQRQQKSQKPDQETSTKAITSKNHNEIELESGQQHVKGDLPNDKELDEVLKGNTKANNCKESPAVGEKIMDSEDLRSITILETGDDVDQFIIRQSELFDELFSSGARQDQKDRNFVTQVVPSSAQNASQKESYQETPVANINAEKLPSIKKKFEDELCSEGVDNTNHADTGFDDFNEAELENKRQFPENIPKQKKPEEILESCVKTDAVCNEGNSDTLFSEVGNNCRNSETIEDRIFNNGELDEGVSKKSEKNEELRRNTRATSSRMDLNKILQIETLKISKEESNETSEDELIPAKKRTGKNKVIDSEDYVLPIKSLRNEKLKILIEEGSETSEDELIPAMKRTRKKRVMDSEDDVLPIKSLRNEKLKILKEVSNETSGDEFIPAKKRTGRKKVMGSVDDILPIKSLRNEKLKISKEVSNETSEDDFILTKKRTGKKNVIDSEGDVLPIEAKDESPSSAVKEKKTVATEEDEAAPVGRRSLRNRTIEISREERHEKSKEELDLTKKRGRKKKNVTTQEDNILHDGSKNLDIEKLEKPKDDKGAKPEGEPVLSKTRGRKRKAVSTQRNSISNGDAQMPKSKVVMNPDVENESNEKVLETPSVPRDKVFYTDDQNKENVPLRNTPSERALANKEVPRPVYDVNTEIEISSSQKSKSSDGKRKLSQSDTRLIEKKAKTNRRLFNPSDLSYMETDFTIDDYLNTEQFRKTTSVHKNQRNNRSKHNNVDNMNKSMAERKKSLSSVKTHSKMRNCARDVEEAKENYLNGERERPKSATSSEEDGSCKRFETHALVHAKPGLRENNNKVRKETNASKIEHTKLKLSKNKHDAENLERLDLDKITVMGAIEEQREQEETKKTKKEPKKFKLSKNIPDADSLDLNKITTIETIEEQLEETNENKEITEEIVRENRKPATRKKQARKKTKQDNSKSGKLKKAIDDYFSEFNSNYIFTEEDQSRRAAFDVYYGDITNRTRDRELRSARKRKRAKDSKRGRKRSKRSRNDWADESMDSDSYSDISVGLNFKSPKVKILENVVLKSARPLRQVERTFDTLMEEHLTEKNSKTMFKDETTKENESEILGEPEPIASSSRAVPPPISRGPRPFASAALNDSINEENLERFWTKTIVVHKNLTSLLVQNVPPRKKDSKIYQALIELNTKY